MWQEASLKPRLKQVSITRTSKRHRGKQGVLLEGSNPTDSLSAFTRLERIEALSNFTVAVGILIPIVDSGFINIDNLLRLLGL